MSARNISDDADTNDGRVVVWALQEVKESLDALVKQQRIANLIALAQFRAEGQEGAVVTTQTNEAIKWRLMAAEGLGL